MTKYLGAATAALLTIGIALTGLTTMSAAAAPGNPGVPSDPTVVYQEDFENDLADGESVELADYTGASGATYTATPYWAAGSFCNGIVLDSTSADTFGCVAGNQLRTLASVLGEVDGLDAPGVAANHAVAAYTNGDTPDFPLAAGDVEFATEDPVAVPAGSRFLTFSVDSAALNCGVSAPLLSFSLVDGVDEIAVSNDPINPCTDPRASAYGSASAGSFAADSALLFDGTEMGIVLRNGNGSGSGNDAAFDNIQVLDATPQLDKTFGAQDPHWYTGDAVPLTFTITNTSELAEKAGWGFVDELPEGLTATGASSTTCDAATIVAVDGEDTITVTDGALGTGDVSCIVQVFVEADGPGEFENGPSNVTTTGLNPPGTSTLVTEDEDPALEIEKTATLADVNGNGFADAGEEIVYGFEVENTGNVDLTDVAVEDDRLTDAGVAVTPMSVDLEIGATESFTSDPYTVTAEDVAAGEITNVALAAGTGRDGVERIVSDVSTVTTPTRDPVVPPAPTTPEAGGLLPSTGVGTGLLAATIAGLGAVGTGLLVARRRRTGAHAAI